LPLVIAVAVGLLVFVLRRTFFGRRLTIEQSVDRYRRTLSAVHDAASRSSASDGPTAGRSALAPPRRRRSQHAGRVSRWRLAVAVMVVATVGTVGVVVAQSRGKDNDRASTTTTTQPPTTNPTTTTTRAAPTTTVALVTASGATGHEFTIAKPSYTLVVAATGADCWVDARDPAGASLFTGLLSAGRSQSIAAAAVDLQLGNPAAITVAVEGKPVPFTLANGSPITLRFRGSGTTG
jgi:cytoskeletal protein RodZ